MSARRYRQPNCTTIQMVVAPESHRKAFSYKNQHVSTYQAASGAGAAIQLYEHCSGIGKRTCDCREVCLSAGFQPDSADRRVFVMKTVIRKKEMKMYNETRKIMHSDT